ncbi:uncharacterized protein LOC132406848 [Hypanus sabinus]|uniref:uncharacterized protein LOC132406848 n=1 Tax=Hypanus sabinus TaxID=79690 RepID=UPI0028C46ADE|nr:uncharacterized protein LOC132406848 [Hypanus sabinus]
MASGGVEEPDLIPGHVTPSRGQLPVIHRECARHARDLEISKKSRCSQHVGHLVHCNNCTIARGTEPSNGAQKKSEVFDSVERDGRPCRSDRLGSVGKELTLVTVGSESSQVFVLQGVFKVNAEFKNGGIRIIIEGNGNSVVPKSNEEMKPGDSGASHSIVMPGCGVKRPNSKCCLNKEFELKTNSLKGPEERASHLCKIKELGGNGLSLGHLLIK